MGAASRIRPGVHPVTILLSLHLAGGVAEAAVVGQRSVHELSGTVSDPPGVPVANSINALTDEGYGKASVPSGAHGAFAVTGGVFAAFPHPRG